MTTLAFLAFGAICGLVGFAFGCDYMRKVADEEAKRRAFMERAYDKLWERLRLSQATTLMLMEMGRDPWALLREEIEDMPEQRDANLRRGEQ